MISIRRTLLVARQEFVKYVTRRGFIISLLMMPLIMALSIAVPGFTAAHPRTNVMTVVDLAGGYEAAIAAAVARDNAQSALQALAGYARQYADLRGLKKTDPELAHLLGTPERLTSVKRFAARGGWQPAFEKLVLKPGTPAFDVPQPAVVLVPAPPEIAADLARGRSAAPADYLRGTVMVPAQGGMRRLDSIVFIPKDFGPQGAAQYWSLDSDQSRALVRTALNDAVRLRQVRALVAPQLRSHIDLDVEAPLVLVDPLKGKEAGWKDRVAQLVPVGLAFLLFIVAFSDAALLLQGVVEEKSTRMIEVLLSCAGPHEIMTGKLLGVIGLALVTILGWAAMGLGLAAAFSSEALPVVAAGLQAIAPMAPLVLLYFLCGLMIYAAIFLGIGATSSSLPDAQALLGPASLIIFLPNMLLSALIQNPNGLLAQVISWIPIYTPFFMLVRLPFHPAPLEIWATAILTLATTALLIRQMGRVFARHVLTAERPPSLGVLLRLLLRRGA